MGLIYIKNWSPWFFPILTLLTGLFSVFGLISIGHIINKKLKININNTWENLINLILGIFTFSFCIQLLSFFRLNNKFSLGILAILIIFFGFQKISLVKLKIPKVDKKTLVPSSLLVSIFIIRVLISVIPATKIDELHYHMLLPIRLISEKGLNFYNLPWEGAIWPHMQYQFIGAPFYAIGLPDSVNVISLGIFLTLLSTLFFQLNREINNKEITLWCLVLFSSGLHSLVDLTTNASNSLLLASSFSSLLILCNPTKFLPSNNLKSFSLIFGLLSLGMIGSKISMMPILMVQTLIFFRTIHKVWGINKIPTSIIYFSLPLIIFFVPIVSFTWIKSGSPFGPLLSSLFSYKGNIDPLISSVSGDIGYEGNLKDVIFLCITKWTPLIWLSWLFIFNKNIQSRLKTTFLSIIVTQLLIIWLILPDLPRHLGGYQYVGIFILFVEFIPKIFYKFRKFFISIFLIFSVPWLFIDFYYSYPLLSKAFFKQNIFKRDYIPFYKDFVLLNDLLERNSEILVYGSRINSFHSPRKVLFNPNQLGNNNKPKYLFLVGTIADLPTGNPVREEKLKLGKLIYQNNVANIMCYRTPNKKCKKGILRVYKIDF